MTSHLLAVELGPIVEFLSAARKTRDLWFGSWLFSDIAKRVARRVAVECGETSRLVFPAATDAQLTCDDFTVGDVILAEVPDGIDPKCVADAARRAAHDAWLEFAGATLGKVRAGDVDEAMWRAQTCEQPLAGTAGDVIETYAAWAPIGDSYAQARERVMRLLAARTATRNFPPAPGNDPAQLKPDVDDAGRWKSSLDGRRPSVLAGSDRPRVAAHRDRRLRLSPGEKLDAPGLVKRLSGGSKNYPSTARLAADPWVRQAGGQCLDLLEKLNAAAERLVALDILGRVDVKRFPHYGLFPFEGAALFDTRHAELLDEAEVEPERRADVMLDLRSALAAVKRRVGEPNAYYAIIAADGDHVGHALKQVESAPGHRRLSRAISDFADVAKRRIAEHSGAAIYVGGDDVLALLPLDQAVPCADVLRRDFAATWSGLSLSAGVVFWHFLDALEDGLAAAREALDMAKRGTGAHDERNALAVRYVPRGGAPLVIRRRWETGIADEFSSWAKLLADGSLPAKVAYDLRRAADGFRQWPAGAERGRALRADLLRLLSRKSHSARRALTSLVESVAEPDDAVTLANTIIVAGRIAAVASPNSHGAPEES